MSSNNCVKFIHSIFFPSFSFKRNTPVYNVDISLLSVTGYFLLQNRKEQKKTFSPFFKPCYKVTEMNLGCD